eukprot:11854097-Prorocentrum_lima.AAC.1
MEPTIQQWMCMRDPEGRPMWIRANGSTRRTSPCREELLLGDDHIDHDFIELEEETPLTALKIQYRACGAEIVNSLQDVDDPTMLSNLAWE